MVELLKCSIPSEPTLRKPELFPQTVLDFLSISSQTGLISSVVPRYRQRGFLASAGTLGTRDTNVFHASIVFSIRFWQFINGIPFIFICQRRVPAMWASVAADYPSL